LGKDRIDKDTQLQNLPEKVFIEFLDFISEQKGESRQLTLKWIKEGRLILECWED
jgi:hypothetical protein